MFRVLFISVFCLLQTAAILSAQTSLNPADSVAVVTAMARQETAWNRGDIDEFMETYWKSDNLQFIGANGPTYGWQQTLDNYKRRYPDREAMGKLSFDILTIDQRSPTVISLVGKFHLERTIGNLEGYFLLLWQKFDGKWLIVADHTS